MNHNPFCATNRMCAVLHENGCPDKKDCDCGAEKPKTMNTDWEERFEEEFLGPFAGHSKAHMAIRADAKIADVKSFITTEKESSRKEGLEEAKKVLGGMGEEREAYFGDDVEKKLECGRKIGYNQALTQALQKLQEQIDR